MQKRWRIEPHDAPRIAALERTAGVPPVLAQLLLARGVNDVAGVRAFLDGKLTHLRDPEELPGVPAAVERIDAAVRAGRRIYIYGDYDADGMTAAAILVRTLRLLNADVHYYVPNRLEEGYGLNDEALAQLAARGASLVITVDCGIASIAEAETARRLGLELIITDHHEPAERLPEAAAIVHPSLPGGGYPFAGLCGAGVAFKLAWALCQRAAGAKKVNPAMRNMLLTAIGLASLGAVADVVPLLDENRILVRHGLVSLRNQPPLGIARLMHITELDQKPLLQAEDIAFTLAPRLNAAGRLGQAALGIDLLTTDDPDRADSLARYIHQLNEDRGALERKIYLAANKQAKEQFDPENDPALVLADRGWHVGVIGIVAGRLAERYCRPVILLSLDGLGVKTAVGSARSAGVCHLHRALAACSSYLCGFGGHAAAAGLRIAEPQIAAFRSAFCEYVASESPRAGFAELRIDAEAPLSQLTLQTVEQIERLAPFGQGNPRPVLCASGAQIHGPPKRIGGGERHLSLRIRQHHVTLRAVGFNYGESADDLASSPGPLDIAFQPVMNTFKGRRSVEMHLVDWRPSKSCQTSE
jgi:single-stranded-DNA-specific exonuclease